MATIGILALAVALMVAAVPKAYAGAVFEIREEVPANASAYKFAFTDVTTVAGIGKIARSGAASTVGSAGQVFRTSAIPLNIYTLGQCTTVAPHIHPNGAETVFCLEGKVRISQFRGEEDGANVTMTELNVGEAGYIQQGSVHFVENVFPGVSRFLQLFDHPQAGTVFVANAIARLPRNVMNSAFGIPILPASGTVTTFSPLFRVHNCAYRG